MMRDKQAQKTKGVGAKIPKTPKILRRSRRCRSPLKRPKVSRNREGPSGIVESCRGS